MVGVVTSYIWHTDVNAEWPTFFSAARYMISPRFFNKKYMTDPICLDWYMKGATFLTSRYMHIFSRRDFSRLLVLLVFSELTAIFGGIFVQVPAINHPVNLSPPPYPHFPPPTPPPANPHAPDTHRVVFLRHTQSNFLHIKVVPLLQIFFVRESVVSYLVFVL